MKVIKSIVWGLLITFICVIVISVETDFFSNIEEYLPEAVEKYPAVRATAEYIDEMTEDVPSFSQIIASIKNEPFM